MGRASGPDQEGIYVGGSGADGDAGDFVAEMVVLQGIVVHSSLLLMKVPGVILYLIFAKTFYFSCYFGSNSS